MLCTWGPRAERDTGIPDTFVGFHKALYTTVADKNGKQHRPAKRESWMQQKELMSGLAKTAGSMPSSTTHEHLNTTCAGFGGRENASQWCKAATVGLRATKSLDIVS